MSARLLISALLGGALAFVAGVGGPGLAANATLPSPLRIGGAQASAPLIDLVVLGDSYASAATPFDRGSLNLLGAPSVCARGPAWPRLLDPSSVRISLTHVSCSGAMIPDLLDRRMRAGEPVQVQALRCVSLTSLRTPTMLGETLTQSSVQPSPNSNSLVLPEQQSKEGVNHGRSNAQYRLS